MSTRCNVKIINGKDETWLYRHHDGYASQAGKHLMLLADDAFGTIEDPLEMAAMIISDGKKNDVKYEFTDDMHGDIAYLYTIDLNECSVKMERV